MPDPRLPLPPSPWLPPPTLPLPCPAPTGATALDRKAKKKFDAEQLARMGARAEARPRVPANIGLGMARKQAQRDERALQEGIAGGAELS